MSAITEYIHFYQSNYQKYGIVRKGSDNPSPSLEVSFNEIKNRISDGSELSELLIEAKQIEKEYNDLFFPKFQTDFSKMLLEIAQEELKKQFGDKAGQITSNFNIQGNTQLNQYKKALDNIVKNLKISYLEKKATVKTMLKRIEQLSKILLQLENSDSKIIKNKLQRGRQQLQQVQKSIQQKVKLQNNNFSKDIETINKLIQQFDRSFTVHNQRGDLFEWMLPLIKLKSANLSKEELKKAMKNLIGSNNFGNEYVEIKLSDFIENTIQQPSSSVNTDQMEMKIVNVRNRIDVKIQYDIGNGQYKEIPVSAKSVSKKNVKILDETTLQRILLFSQNYNFARHYLNIITYSDDLNNKASESQIFNANKIVKSLIIQLGLQGFDLKNPAELLILHNVKKGKIEVYNIKALIYIIKEKINSQNFNYRNIITGFNEDFTIKQSFQDTVEKRLNSILNTIHGTKITAHIKAAQLNDYLKLLEN